MGHEAPGVALGDVEEVGEQAQRAVGGEAGVVERFTLFAGQTRRGEGELEVGQHDAYGVLEVVHQERRHLVAEALQLLHLVVALHQLALVRLQRQEVLDAHAQLAAIDRLGEKIVGAHAQPEHARRRVGQRRHQQHRQELAAGQLLEPHGGLEAVEVGHHDVDERQIRQRGRRPRERLGARRDLDDLMTLGG
jgi:hypothetical protein